MAIREYGARSIRWRLGGAQWGPFDGGLNLRDAYLDVQPNELIAGTNLTLDERGEIYKRFDSPASASFPSPPAGTVTSSFYSAALGVGIIQVGATVYKAALGAGAWTSFHTFTDTNFASFVDFAGKLVYVHPTDGMRVYDGTTDSLASATVRGRVIATWQNKVFACWGIDPRQYVPPYSATRIFWSAAGDPTSWTTATDFVDVREKDDKPIFALWPSSGLLAFKEDSTYRINDSTTGSYATIDWQAGAVGAKAITSSDGRIYFWGLDGLYATNGVSPAVNVGDKVRPLFPSSTVNATTKPKISAATVNNRVYFAFPRFDLTVCDEILEYNPRAGWIMEHSLGGSAVGPLFGYQDASGIRQVSYTFGSAAIKDLFTTGSPAGITFSFRTGWVEPFGPGALGRLERLTLTGNFSASAFTVAINYVAENGTSSGGPVWSTPFTPAVGFQSTSFQPKIQGRAFQLQITDPGASNFRIFNAQMSNVLSAIR